MGRRTALIQHPIAIAGVLLTTAGAVGFAALLAAELWGLFDDPYAGLVVFALVPAIVVLGLLLIPLGMWLEHRRLGAHPGAERDWFVIDFRSSSTRRRAIAVLALTAVNLTILLLAGYGSLHYMESPTFCGQACHTPMHPQFTAWQDAPHSRVTCVQCHIGEGGRAFVHYKLNGLRQLYHVVTGAIPRPIPGVADMRPAQQVCGACHWSGKDFGDVVRVKREYADDEANTETTTILQMRVGGPGVPTSSGRAIHWHADPKVQVEYVSTDAERQTIPYVRVTDAQGQVREFTADGATPADIAKGQRRFMDCIDCHNIVAHRVAQTPEQAVDRAIAAGRIPRGLPFVRREGVRLIKASHASEPEAVQAIGDGLQQFYTSTGSATDAAAVAGAVTSLQNIYRRNVFPVMKVTFGTYPDNVGHTTSSGCFRCHDGSHTAKDGTMISAECEYCHKQLEPRATAGAQ